MNERVPLARGLPVASGADAARQRVVINGRFLGRRVTGVERYAIEIVRAIDTLIAEGHPLAVRFRFSLAVPGDAEFDAPLHAIRVERVGLWPPRLWTLSSRLWEQLALPYWSGRDPILNFCNTAPVLSPRNVTCLHDANVWLVPRNYSLGFRLLYRLLLPLSVRRSRRWMTVSRFSGEQLHGFGVADRPPEAITPCGADHALRWSSVRSSLDPARLPVRYVLALGSRSLNKNFALAHELAGHLAAKGIRVVTAGGDNSKVFGRPAASRSSEVIALGRVSDDDLALLYERATAFLFPSLYEGFGLPPVEAMQFGCPVVASNTTSMPEVLGDAALLCDPAVIGEWVAAVDRLASDAALRQELIRRGRERAAGLTWRRSALAVLRLLDEITAPSAGTAV